MKKMSIQNKLEYKNQNSYTIEAKRESQSKDGQQTNKKSYVFSNLVNFDINCYPFMNEKARPENIYRTALSLKISNDQLRKLMKLNHPNIINIQKITRGHNKEVTHQHQQDVYFSFYYEGVSFSLKYLALYQDRASNILKKLTQVNLMRILTNLSEYLSKIGVFYLYNLDNIGITRQGEIKVYVSPVLFCDDRYLRGQKSMIFVSIDKIVAWWQTTIASSRIINPKSSNIVLPSAISLEDQSSLDSIIKANQSSFMDKETSQLIGEQTEQNNDHRFCNSKQPMMKTFPLKNSSNYTQSELSKMNSYQMNKIKKIDQEVKYIKQRLKNKKRIHNQSQYFSEIKDKYRNMYESDRFQKKDLSNDKINASQPNVIEKIQQNINCINIYTLPKENTQKKSPLTKIKKMTSQPIYSYKISPDNFKIKINKARPKVIVHHPSFQPQDFPNSESESSVNTYEMDLQAEFQTARALQKNNAIFSDERQISEKNYRPSYENENTIQKKNHNQVVKRHVTESAGPLQFKNFINRHIKPQFLAKKSNIYEDPMEYESEKSKSISNKKKKTISDLYSNGKSANSRTQKSSSLNQKAHQGCYKKKDNVYSIQISQQNSAKMMMKEGYLRFNSQIKLMPIREMSTDNNNIQNFRKSKNDSKIAQRVKLVLQKTKNVIALLNRVKNSRSLPQKFN